MVCGHCKQPGHTNTKKKPCTNAPPPVHDPITSDIVRKLYKAFVFDETTMAEIEALVPGLHIRRTGMKMELSENIVKFAIQSKGDVSCTWGGDTGDLYSDVEGIQEVKSITAIDSPTSFGPTQPWDVIYFLDASGWRDNLFVIWRIPLANTHDFWKTLPMNKNQTKEQQSGDGRRPRTIWSTQIKPLLETQFPELMAAPFYSGTFEGIFAPLTNEMVMDS